MDLEASPVEIIVGSHVWVEDPDLAWIDAQVTWIDGQDVHVQTTNGKKLVTDISKVFPNDAEAPPRGVDDMPKVSYFHEPSVLQNLAARCELNELYTYTGNILIAINPFQRLPHLYDTHTVEQYKGAALGQLSCHVFAIADVAYRTMINERKSSSILVSGESGAGKTETAKMLMRYLGYLGSRSGMEGQTVDQQVLGSNPVLEAFAKTVKNNSSIRFGKFVETQFDKSGRISGAAVKIYLLERSCVCQISDPERNYRCFYLLCAAPAQERENYKLGSPESFYYLNQSKCDKFDGVSDAEEYPATRRAMDIAGLSEEEQEAIFRLHLGKFEFSKGKEIKDEKSRFHLNTTAELLRCDPKSLEDALIEPVMVTPEEVITRTLDPEAALDSRDALAKTIYSQLFDWIVDQMNISIGQHSNSKAIIGVLDTYWFESIGQSSTDDKTGSQTIFDQMGLKCYQFGKTKVLLRAGQMAELDARRAQVLGNAARTIQRQCRTYIARKNFNLLRQAAIQLQSCWRAISACKLYEQLLPEDAAIKIQKNFRCHTAQISYLTLQDSAVIVQTSMRAMAARVTKEREARKAAEEAPPVIKQTPVVVQDTSKVESLKALLLSEKQVAEEAKKTCADTVTKNMDLAKNLEEAEAKVDQLQDFTQRLEKELSNLKSENRQLRQIALTMPPTGEAISAEPTMTIIPENQNVLINCISQELGFSDGKPVAASIIYESLLQWKSFEVERTSVFDRIIQTVASAIEVPDNDDVLAYWLCNTSTLLMLLQRTLKASGAASLTLQRRRPSSASPFGRMSQGLRASPQSAGLSFINGRMLGRVDDLRQVEAKYPALLFKQQLTALLEKIYGLIRDNLKKEIAPLLGLCIQAPRRSRSSLVKGRSRANAVAQQALIAHWQSIVKSLNNYLKIMKANYVPPFLVRKVFTQIFLFINVQLFNSLLLRRECCSLSNGEYVKAGLAELEQWCCSATEEYVGSAWDELKHIRQAVGFLVIHQKPRKTLNEITNELCPVLSIQQLYRISTMYWDDKYGTHSVSSDVISSMRVMMTEDSNNSVSSSFLLDDDSSIPFSVDDISKSMQHIQVAVVKPDPLIRENSRLEENLSDVKSKNQVLCQQAPTMPPTGKAIPAQPMSTMIPRTPENGNILNGETKSAHATALVVANLEEPESEDKPQKSLNEEQQDLLIKCISQDLGFSGGKPVAACIVYRSLLHWRSFEVERASVFDCIVQTVVSAIKVSDKYDVLAYWLCNTSTLLMLLQYTLKASGDASLTPQRQSSAASLFGRMSQGSSASPESSRLSIINGQMLGRLDNLRQVEAKKPAFLFKQQLTALLEKIYGRTRDNLKKEISPLLDLSIQAPRTSRASSVKGRPRANAVAQQALIAHWQSIVRSLNNYLKIMKENYVPPFLVQKIFTQMFSFINVQLFNSLLLRRECCSFSNGEYVKAGLAELEQWCCYATEEYVGSAWDELKHVRQAVEFLIIHQKPKKTLNQIRKELCPVLSIQQLYKISTMYWDDKYDTDGFSSDVISSMRFLVAIDSNSSASSNLDDDLSIPISADDLSQSMRPIEVADVEPPPLLSENAGFAFLHQRNDQIDESSGAW